MSPGARISHSNRVVDERRIKCGCDERHCVALYWRTGVSDAELTTEGLLDLYDIKYTVTRRQDKYGWWPRWLNVHIYRDRDLVYSMYSAAMPRKLASILIIILACDLDLTNQVLVRQRSVSAVFAF